MEQINEKQYNNASKLPAIKKSDNSLNLLTNEQFKACLEEMKIPSDAQRDIAVKIKNFLDQRIEIEMTERGYLSDHTRRWVETYNNILEKIHKAIYGDKSINLHEHHITHGDISTRIRNAEKIIDV